MIIQAALSEKLDRMLPSVDTPFADVMARLRTGDADAAATVFFRFGRALVELARRHLDVWLRRKVDPEDVVQSVYRSFFVRQAAGDFQVADWNELWGLLTLMTLRKCALKADHHGAARRDGRREEGWSSEVDLSVPTREPTPLEAAVLTDTLAHLMAGLPERDRDLVILVLQGYTIPEMSARLGRSERTLFRRLDAVRDRLRQLETETERDVSGDRS